VERVHPRTLAPFAPHLAEELWAKLGEAGSVHQAPWPEVDSSQLVEETVEVVVQIDGKRRGQITLSPEATQEEALMIAKQLPAIAAALEAGEPKRVVYVPGRILNIVPAKN
jgi:leucyl-tRNA synthetase